MGVDVAVVVVNVDDDVDDTDVDVDADVDVDVDVDVDRPTYSNSTRIFKASIIVALLFRNSSKTAICIERPSVVGTPKGLSSAATYTCNDLSSAMRASVVQHFNSIILMPDHDDWLVGNRGGEVITNIWDLACVTHVYPGVSK